ncbi:TetR/AcrR family transcriptional regulator [Sphingomonas sp. DT-204]|uniref:TetR/AcrR family transcriptional regulator n=1 Tax=Sphingomonas sp. DT-204 TaxID=3396166 RepID=UPI003F1BF933
METAHSEAHARAARWCEAQIGAIRGEARGAAAMGPLLAALIDDWCETRRTLAFAWRESELMALRDARHVASCGKWHTLWLGFWQEVCAGLGIPEMATDTTWMFEGASALHLLRWRRPLDRAALSELCHGWAGWLEGRLAAPAVWFELARRDATALITPPAPDDPVADAIASAAAATIARRGVAALTHRAVAAEAGVTLGMVSYKFRTSADLLHAAFEAIYRRMVPQSTSELAAMPDIGREEALARIEVGFPAREDMLGADELLTACARDPAFQAFAAQLRYLRGRTSGRYFQALMGRDRPIAPIDAAIFSALLSGRSRAHLCGGRTLTDGASSGDFTALLARLDGG